jgi:predicted acyl esterase
MERRELLAQIAASLGTALIPWELLHAAKVGVRSEAVLMSKLLPVLPDRRARGKVTSDIMISARDGFRLATDVYLPDGLGRKRLINTTTIRASRLPVQRISIAGRLRKGWGIVRPSRVGRMR